MKKIKPRNKICFQTYTKPAYLRNKKIKKFEKKKWFFIKNKIIKTKEQIYKPEKQKLFFKKRLIEKQKFKTFYGCISNYKVKKIKKNNIILNNFIKSIESHLDINLLRIKKIKTIFQAQQLINHKKIKVNNKIINKSTFILKPGDRIFLLKNK